MMQGVMRSILKESSLFDYGIIRLVKKIRSSVLDTEFEQLLTIYPCGDTESKNEKCGIGNS